MRSLRGNAVRRSVQGICMRRTLLKSGGITVVANHPTQANRGLEMGHPWERQLAWPSRNAAGLKILTDTNTGGLPPGRLLCVRRPSWTMV